LRFSENWIKERDIYRPSQPESYIISSYLIGIQEKMCIPNAYEGKGGCAFSSGQKDEIPYSSGEVCDTSEGIKETSGCNAMMGGCPPCHLSQKHARAWGRW